MKNKIKNILLIGQTPPPYHGQSIMISKIINHENEFVKIYHIRLHFSDQLNEIGRFKISKIAHLVVTIIKSWTILITKKIDGIYYPPAGNQKNAIIRDIFIISCLKVFRKKMIFHFHAMGLLHFYSSQANWYLKKLMSFAYNKPELAICLSESNISEIKFLNPEKICILPYGIEDNYSAPSNNKSSQLRVLYLGNLYKSKGVLFLMDAAKSLFQKGMKFELVFVGGFKDPMFENEVRNHDIYDFEEVNFLGIKTGREKWEEFKKADIFCFPTKYENENFPVVLLEALSFGLPIVTVNWRGTSDIIENGVNGFLANDQNTKLIANHLETLIKDKNLRQRISINNRKKYVTKYKNSIYTSRIYELFQNI